MPDKKDVTTRRILKDVLEHYNITQKYIVIVSDNAMKSTFKDLYPWQSCNAHNMNLLNRSFFFRDDLHHKCSQYADEPFYFLDIETLLNFDDTVTEEELFDMMFKKQLKMSEMAKLCYIKTELKSIIRLIISCKKLVKAVKQCNLSNQLETKLIQEIESRWDTHLNMLQSLRRNKASLELIEHSTVKLVLEGIDFELMDHLISFLEVLTQIRLGWSFDSKPTLNSVIPNCLYMKKFASLDPKSAFIRNSSDLFSSILDEKIFLKVSAPCKVACFMSPKDFSSWYSQGFSYNIDFLESIIPELKHFSSFAADNEQTSKRQIASQPAPEKKQKTADFSSPYGTERDSDLLQEHESEKSLSEEAQEYFHFVTDKSSSFWKSTDPIQFWKLNRDKFPLLFQASLCFLAIPATSIASERLFASVWFTVNTLRSSLSTETVQFLQSINKNSHFLNIGSSSHLRELITKALSEISRKNVSISYKK